MMDLFTVPNEVAFPLLIAIMVWYIGLTAPQLQIPILVEDISGKRRILDAKTSVAQPLAPPHRVVRPASSSASAISFMSLSTMKKQRRSSSSARTGPHASSAIAANRVATTTFLKMEPSTLSGWENVVNGIVPVRHQRFILPILFVLPIVVSAYRSFMADAVASNGTINGMRDVQRVLGACCIITSFVIRVLCQHHLKSGPVRTMPVTATTRETAKLENNRERVGSSNGDDSHVCTQEHHQPVMDSGTSDNVEETKMELTGSTTPSPRKQQQQLSSYLSKSNKTAANGQSNSASSSLASMTSITSATSATDDIGQQQQQQQQQQLQQQQQPQHDSIADLSARQSTASSFHPPQSSTATTQHHSLLQHASIHKSTKILSSLVTQFLPPRPHGTRLSLDFTIPCILWLPRTTTMHSRNALHVLCKTGPYALCQHPTALAWILCCVGIWLWTSCLQAAPAVWIALHVVKLQIPQEEMLLRHVFGREYELYQSTRKWLIPGVY